MNQDFKAMLVEENADGTFSKQVKSLPGGFLRAGELTVRVQYSSLNYKDALSSSGNKGITRNYPHIPGIDSAGIVVECASGNFKPGDEVIVTGYDFGMNTFGGFSEYISVPEAWAVPRPAGLTLREAMTLGTSGFTASIGVSEIVRHGTTPGKDKVLVTGATGAVGSSAVSILSKLGFYVIASTGKKEEATRLEKLGASEVIDRSELADVPKAMLSKRWAAAFDTVGGEALSYVLKATADHGIVTNCGMIGSPKLETSIMPFIIRGVRLVGIAAADTPMPQRLDLWNKLSSDYKIPLEEDFFEEITLDELPSRIDLMLAGKLKKKVVIKIGE